MSRVLFLVPDLFVASGGIARYCRLVCKALSESPEISQLDVIALNDSVDQQPDSRYLSTTHSTYHPAGGNKAWLMSKLTLMLRQDYDIFLSGHVHLTPLLYVYRHFSLRSALLSLVYGVDVWGRLPWFRRVPLINSDVIMAISQFTQSQMIRSNCVNPAKTRILHNCLDPYLMPEQRENGVADSAPKLVQSPSLLTVSRLSKYDRHKGHVEILKALSYVRQQIPGMHYYVVGQGTLVSELQKLSSELGLDSVVHFLGFVDETVLRLLYDQSDVFVMPSRKEGFGFVFLEAMAYGKPVIAGNQDASAEVVRHGKTGLLVDPTDSSEVAGAIVRLLSEPDLRQRMGARGAEVVASEFGFDRFCKSLLAYVREAVEQRRRTGRQSG